MAARLLPIEDGTDPAFPGLSDAQFGSIVEERLATAVLTQAPGIASIGFPLVDLGFDFYLRRIRTLRVHPVQVKGRSFLDADRLFQASVSSLAPDPRGYVVLPYVPPPDWQLASQMFVVPIPEFLRLVHRHKDGYLLFSAHLDPSAGELATPFLVESNRLETQWLRKIPGWKDPVHGPELTVDPVAQVAKRAARSFGKVGELWLASQVIGVALDGVSIAQDRLRLDCVDLLLHDLNSFAVLGLGVHCSSINARGHVQFRNRYQTFFIDDRLFIVLMVFHDGGALHETGFLIPSGDIPKILTESTDHHGDIGFQANFKLEPLAEKMRPYAVPVRDLAGTIVRRLRDAPTLR